MRRFANVLEQARQRLQVPEPSRTRILLEIAADLEDSYQHYIDQGCDEAEAVRRAEDAFGASGETLQLLGRLYQTGCGGGAERVSQQVGTLWSKLLVTVLLAFEVLLAARILTDRTFFVYPSPFLWPIGAIALAAFCFTVWKLVQIFARSDVGVRRLRTGLGIPLFFAGASLLVTATGSFFHLQRFFRVNSIGAPETLFMNFAGWMVSISSMLTIGLVTAILAGMVWFVLSRLVARAEVREVESLLRGTV